MREGRRGGREGRGGGNGGSKGRSGGELGQNVTYWRITLDINVAYLPL